MQHNVYKGIKGGVIFMVYVEKTSNKRHMQEPDLAINRTQTGQLFLCI